jgi:hypothetical protein
MFPFVFESCNKEIILTGPVIRFTNSILSDTVPLGESEYTISGTVFSTAELQNVKCFLIGKQDKRTQLEVIAIDKSSYDTIPNDSIPYIFNFQFALHEISETLEIEVKATDKDNNSGSSVFTIYKSSNSFAFVPLGSNTTLADGVTNYTIKGRITSNSGITSIKCKSKTETGVFLLDELHDFPDPENCSFEFAISNIYEDLKIAIEYTDSLNLTVSKDFTIYKHAGKIDSWNSTMGFQVNDKGNSFASKTGMVYDMVDSLDNSSEIDWVCFYDPDSAATFATPADSLAVSVYPSITTWSAKNMTRFERTEVSAADFDAISNDAPIIQAVNTPKATHINSLSENEVLAFYTALGKKGLIKIGSIVPGDTGNISITVKVKK